MTRNHIKYEKEGLQCIVEYLYEITTQLVEGLHTKSNKIKNVRKKLLGKNWVTIPLENISVAQYTFYRIFLVLNKRIQLER